MASAPAAAQAAPVGTGGAASDAAALAAYHGYLSDLQASASISGHRAATLVASVQRGCAGRLSDLNGYSADQLDASALSAYGDEVAAGLSLAYLAPTRASLDTFTDRLSDLSWPTGKASSTVTALVRAEQRMAALSAPHLCADAKILDAEPLGEPPSSAAFLHRYRSAASALHRALDAFGSLLVADASTADSDLISTVNTQVGQFSASSDAVEQADASAILSALGVSSVTQDRDPALRRHYA